MDGKTLARISAAAFVALTATLAAIEMSSRNRVSEAPNIEANTASVRSDPLHGLLVRCRELGAAAIRDPVCLKAWADNRRRFLGTGTSHDTDPSSSSDSRLSVPSDRFLSNPTAARPPSPNARSDDPLANDAFREDPLPMPMPSAPREDR